MNYKLYNGDCIEVMKKIDNKSVDMILCDLPFGTTLNQWDKLINFEKLWEQYERIITDSGAIVLFGSEPFTTKLNNSNLKLYRYSWIWKKNNSTGFQLANKRPLKNYETISVFYKSQPVYNPQGIIECGKVNKRGASDECWTYPPPKSNCYIQKYTNYPTQILEFNIVNKRVHKSQKPVDLLSYLIRTYTNDNMTILDNCFGSNSTGVAVLETGGNRKYIGIEKDVDFFNIGSKRMEELRNGGKRSCV